MVVNAPNVASTKLARKPFMTRFPGQSNEARQQTIASPSNTLRRTASEVTCKGEEVGTYIYSECAGHDTRPIPRDNAYSKQVCWVIRNVHIGASKRYTTQVYNGDYDESIDYEPRGCGHKEEKEN